MKLFPWAYRFADEGRVTGEHYRGPWDNVGTAEQLAAARQEDLEMTLYIPPHFRVEERDGARRLHRATTRSRTLVSAGDAGAAREPHAAAGPNATRAARSCLRGHVARGNAQWQALEAATAGAGDLPRSPRLRVAHAGT